MQGYAGNPQGQGQAQAEGTWSTGFCDCFSDCSNCCITCWCPCITFGQIAEIVDRGSTTCGTSGALYGLLCGLTGFAWVYSCFYRSKIRKQYNLSGNDCLDCLSHCCCELCSLTQEYRELKHRGFDMSIGWQGNMEKQGAGGVAMGAPVLEGNMKR